jgi:hypothetical protein
MWRENVIVFCLIKGLSLWILGPHDGFMAQGPLVEYSIVKKKTQKIISIKIAKQAFEVF